MMAQVIQVGEKYGHIHASSGRVNTSAVVRYLLQVALKIESQNGTENHQVLEQLRTDNARLQADLAAARMP